MNEPHGQQRTQGKCSSTHGKMVCSHGSHVISPAIYSASVLMSVNAMLVTGLRPEESLLSSENRTGSTGSQIPNSRLSWHQALGQKSGYLRSARLHLPECQPSETNAFMDLLPFPTPHCLGTGLDRRRLRAPHDPHSRRPPSLPGHAANNAFHSDPK